MKLEDIKTNVLQCQLCNLYKTKTKYVFGEGSETTPVVFVGEAPGAQEDKTGRPFIGRAGKIFDDLLKSIEMQREGIYVANVLKCRPPKNRSPSKMEIEACTPYLRKQLNVIKPKLVCPMGNFATEFILKFYGLESELKGISKLHGKKFKIKNLFEEIIVIPLYHPAVATYNPDMMKILLEDIKLVKDGN